jgi:outer membrane receptor for ferrienterochelin and colicins
MRAFCTPTFLFTAFFFLTGSGILAQTGMLKGRITTAGKPVDYATVALPAHRLGTKTDSAGNFLLGNIPAGSHLFVISAMGYKEVSKTILITEGENILPDIAIQVLVQQLEDVVVSGTMKEVSKTSSPVPVEVYSKNFFKSNPTPSIFESMQNINGVRPQLNCNVCNTGDIHINGLEGPYTMVMIDGMPIVSGLSTVYGLTGIPQSLIERVEIVKGPASALYGSEAVGGLVNIITKKPMSAPVFAADVFTTNWLDVNTDIGLKFNAGKKAMALFGVNYFNYQNPVDNNQDGFTDVTLQNRISLFNKWSFDRERGRIFSLAARYLYEDRWGGQMNWGKQFRGGDSIYGESIYTNRWEFFGTYQLPVKEKIMLQFSANGHNQNSVYGSTPFMGKQYIGFGQLTWFKNLERHDLLMGAAYRYTWYDDNTPATETFDNAGTAANYPSVIHLPGLFIQDEISINERNKLLAGLRYDYNSLHGSVLTPRINYKLVSKNKKNTLRAGVGNGYRVANVFTEDHAALTGARQVVFTDNLKPETSWNGNVNFVKKLYLKGGTSIGLDATAFYTYFNNRIIPDYVSDPNKIIYGNLDGHAVSKGIGINADIIFMNGLKILAGGTLMDVNFTENGQTQRQLLTERFQGVWSVGYSFTSFGLTVDYTGNVYSPMLLPLLGPLDDRAGESPWWSLQNIQFTKILGQQWEVYGGIKNLLNYTPPANSIARPFDPFDKNVVFDQHGQVVPTPDNPNALTFDPTYMFAPNQGIRGFAGIRYTIR